MDKLRIITIVMIIFFILWALAWYTRDNLLFFILILLMPIYPVLIIRIGIEILKEETG